MRRYINIIPTLSNYSDGVGKFVRILHRALLKEGFQADIYTQDINDLKIFDDIKAFESIPQTGRFQFSLGLFNAVRRTVCDDQNTMFHIHGLWMWVNILPLFVKGMNYVYSPHGSISPITIKSWSFFKKVVFATIQRRVMNNAYLVHATSELEKQWLIRAGVRADIISVIPLCDEPLSCLQGIKDLKKTKDTSFIFVGRLARIKNLENLISAFQSVNEKHKDANLEIIGDFRTPYGQSLVKRATSCKNIFFTGELTQKEVLDRLSCADYFVLPSFSENFSYSALEACYSGCNLVVSSNTPWLELTPSFVSAVFSAEDLRSIETALLKCCTLDTNTRSKGDLLKFTTSEFIQNLQENLSRCKIT
jgi:glycosyltransferase involved in cell wall biosynthesis